MTMTTHDLHLTRPPVAKTGMLIRRPVRDVFEAFIDPAITARFWFTKGSGRLEPGAHIQWEWEMHGVSEQVHVKAIESNRRILIEWEAAAEATAVEWVFAPHDDDTTFVTITSSGFRGDGDSLLRQATDATEGFTLALAGLKALLDHNIRLNLVTDRFPEGVEAG